MSSIDDVFDERPAQRETAEQQAEQVKNEQRDKKYEEIKQAMESRNKFILEMDKLPSQTHHWTDRGAKMTCENAGHQYHEAWKPM